MDGARADMVVVDKVGKNALLAIAVRLCIYV